MFRILKLDTSSLKALVYLIDQCAVYNEKRQGAVHVASFSDIFFIVLRLLTRVISNSALQAVEKVPDVSRNLTF